jgi:hypothetical protein
MTTIRRGVHHHGKRHRFEVTARDESPEAFAAAMTELNEKVRAFTAATTPSVARQSYRKPK